MVGLRRPSLPSTDRPRGRRAGLTGLLLAEAISVMGTRMSLLAVPWLVWITTHDPNRMGLVAGAETLAYVLAGIFLTPIADRVGIYPMSIGTDVASALTMAALAAFYRPLGFGFVVAMVTIVGVLRGIGDKTKHVMLQPTAQQAGTPMVRVTAIFDGLNRVSALVAAGIGGAIIVWLTAAGAIWFDAATFAICAVIVAAVVPAKLFTSDAEETDRSGEATGQATQSFAEEDTKATRKQSYLSSLRGGFQHLRQDRLLFGIVAMLFVTNLFTQASATIFVPLWVADVLGNATALGFVGGAYALGAIVGNVAFAALAPRMPRYATIAAGFLIGGAPRFLVLGLSRDLAVVVTVSFLAGIAMSSVNPTIGALLYERIPPALQTRLFGLTGAIAYGGVPLGGLIGAWLVDGFQLRGGVLVAGGLYFLAALIPIAGYRLWRQMDAPLEGDRREPRPNEFARLLLAGITRAGAWIRRTLRPVGWALGSAGRGLASSVHHSVGMPGRRLLMSTGRFADRIRPARRHTLTLTLSYDAGTWMISARQGRRVMTGPYPVTPSDMAKKAVLLDVTGVGEAVEQIHAAEVADAERRVEQLRAELASIEARLAELRAAM